MSYIGEYSLRFALVVAAAGFGAGIYAGITRRADWTRVAERAVYVVFGFTTLAIASLFYAFATFDFQLAGGELQGDGGQHVPRRRGRAELVRIGNRRETFESEIAGRKS